jgi:hypothetical protein
VMPIRTTGGGNTDGEAPLHWGASSDDVDVARALLDGADPQAANGVPSPWYYQVGTRWWKGLTLSRVSRTAGRGRR